MSFFDAINVAASGLTAESMRMNVSAENLANAETTNGPNGQPYVPQEVVLAQVGGSFTSALAGALGGTAGTAAPGGVEVAGIVNDPTPYQEVYDPTNPSANGKGYVKMPNVSTVTEMTDMIDEQNSYQADVTAMSTAKSMYTDTLDLLK
jgi:flagellar basal-body rod protein FlgC